MVGRSPLTVALLFMVCASAAIAASSLVAKGLGGAWAGPLHPIQVTAGRFWGALPVLIALALLNTSRMRFSLSDVPWRLHLARTTCSGTGAVCMFAAAARMPLGEATAISFLSPIITMALAIPLLGERVWPRHWLTAGLSLLGMIILIRPGTEAFQPAALLALAAAALFGIESIFIKRLTQRDMPLRILLVNNMMGAVLVTPFALLVWTPAPMTTLGLMGLVGVAMVAGQACYLQALTRAPVSRVAPAFYLTLCFAALYDAAAFGVVPTAVAGLGAAFIVAGAVLLSRTRQESQAPAGARPTV